MVDHFENDFGEPFGQDLRALRKHVLAGGDFPVRKNPTSEWWTKLPLSSFSKETVERAFSCDSNAK